MSIFSETAWDKDETGDKLTKELFSAQGKKNTKRKANSNFSSNLEKKLIMNRKKKPQSSRTDADVPGVGIVARSRSLDKKSDTIDSKVSEIVSKKKKNVANKKRKLINESAPSIIPQKKRKHDSRLETLETKKMAHQIPKQKSKSKARVNVETNQNHDPVSKSCNVISEQNGAADVPLTKSQKRRLKYQRKLLNARSESGSSEAASPNKTLTSNSKIKINRLKQILSGKQEPTTKSAKKRAEPESLRERMLARLKSSRFRYLNEQMYNSESWTSKKYFQEDPEAFTAYHEGYRLQVEQWPLNPLDNIIESIKKMPRDYVVADFGCGEARLSESVSQKVHSLDLMAMNDRVTACDMAHTPLLTSRIDVVVFCLSLMGTNMTEYLVEANRVLKTDGILKIAEVESRFDDINEFIKGLTEFGFVNTWKDLSHNLFYFMDFKKQDDIKKKKNKLPTITLKPCLYKKR